MTDGQERDLLDDDRARTAGPVRRRVRRASPCRSEHGGAGLPAFFAVAFAQRGGRVRGAAVHRADQRDDRAGRPRRRAVRHGRAARAISSRRCCAPTCCACQLFSEPGAGSDLAALAARAVRDGADWMLDGQKVWSSGARHADSACCSPAPTPSVPKQAGITAFLLPLDAPGRRPIRPIRQMSGAASFNEVFLTGVRAAGRVPGRRRGRGLADRHRDAGLRTAGVRRRRPPQGRHVRRRAGPGPRAGPHRRPGGAPAARRPLRPQRAPGRTPPSGSPARPPPGSTPARRGRSGKLVASANLALHRRAGRRAARRAAWRDTGEWGTFAWTEHLLGAPGYRLAGGTDEIQRNDHRRTGPRPPRRTPRRQGPPVLRPHPRLSAPTPPALHWPQACLTGRTQPAKRGPGQ